MNSNEYCVVFGVEVVVGVGIVDMLYCFVYGFLDVYVCGVGVDFVGYYGYVGCDEGFDCYVVGWFLM